MKEYISRLGETRRVGSWRAAGRRSKVDRNKGRREGASRVPCKNSAGGEGYLSSGAGVGMSCYRCHHVSLV